MVKHHEGPGFESYDQNDERLERGQTLQEGEVHENREREGGPRTAETWYVSRHYEPRTEVWRGGTPKVRKVVGD